jgi:hypothetical protein
LYQITSLHFLIMVGKRTFAACCIAALSAVTYGQDDGEDDFLQLPTTIWDRINTFTFTNCAAPTEMETCWKAENSTAVSVDEQCAVLQNRMDCALKNCWNRV